MSASSKLSENGSSLHDLDTSQSAIFQHSPTSPSLKVEWEPGCQPDEVYDRLLPAWRAYTRRYLLQKLREEQKWMPDWQKSVRTERRDRYFYFTAIFGTHTFFMTGLPMLFFFGYPRMGRDMLHVVGLGIYTSSVVKDLVCTPRPYSPPIVRLSMSTHHHEYGFPSSHSTNAVSIALLAGQWMYQSREYLGLPLVLASWALFSLYACSIIGGRLYTGMHSVSDIIGGILMGVGCWASWLVAGDWYEAWLAKGSISVPLTLVTTSLFLIHVHPETVDDCPCFEDSIAIISAILGISLGTWQAPQIPTRLLGTYSVVEQIIVVALRITTGIAIMLGWRLVAKSVLLKLLPPIFRFTSSALDFTLPTRRFYTAATDYHQVPSSPLRPVPSFISLHQRDPISTETTPPTSGTVSPVEVKRAGSQSSGLHVPLANGIHHRKLANGSKIAPATPAGLTEARVSKRKRKTRVERAHYDAEVLTKFGVYTGIGYLAGTVVEMLFVVIENVLFR